MSIVRLFAVVAAALAVAGCGGGGSDSGSSGSGDVRVASHSPAKVQATAYEDEGYSAELRLNFEGNFGALNGQTIYIKAEASGEAFQSQPTISYNDTAPYVDVILSDAAYQTPLAGRHNGEITVYVCLDPSCANQLKNSPAIVPYSVVIKPGLRLSQYEVARTVPFGTKPPPVRVAVSLPAGATEWVADATAATDGSYYVEPASDGSANLDITFSMAGVGTRGENIFVTAFAPGLDGGAPVVMQKTLAISYTVEEGSGPPLAFDPNGGSFEFSFGTDQQGYERFSVVALPGSWDRVGIFYLLAPPSASSNSMVGAWLDQSAGMGRNEYFALPCEPTIESDRVCLPAGEYKAAIRFRHTSPDGVMTDVDYPISMTISP